MSKSAPKSGLPQLEPQAQAYLLTWPLSPPLHPTAPHTQRTPCWNLNGWGPAASCRKPGPSPTGGSEGLPASQAPARAPGPSLAPHRPPELEGPGVPHCPEARGQPALPCPDPGLGPLSPAPGRRGARSLHGRTPQARGPGSGDGGGAAGRAEPDRQSQEWPALSRVLLSRDTGPGQGLCTCGAGGRVPTVRGARGPRPASLRRKPPARWR